MDWSVYLHGGPRLGKPVADKPFWDDAQEVARQAAAGYVVDAPRMVGQLLRRVSPDGSEPDMWGRSAVEAADERAKEWQPDYEGRGPVARVFMGGARGLAPLIPIAAAAMTPGGQPAAIGMAAAQFGLSSAQDTEDKLRLQGVPDDEATRAGIYTGAIQGLGETAATAIGMGLLRPARRLFGLGGGATMGNVAERLTDAAIMRPFAKGMGINLLAQPATEVAQDLGTEFVERSFGAKPENAWDIARHSAEAGAGMTLLLGPLSFLAHTSHASRAHQLNAALTSPDAPLPIRQQAWDIVSTEAKRAGVDPASIAQWVNLQRRQAGVDEGRPDDLLAGADSAPMPTEPAAPPRTPTPFEDGRFVEMMNQKGALENELRDAAAMRDAGRFYRAQSALNELNTVLGPYEDQFYREQANNTGPQLGLRYGDSSTSMNVDALRMQRGLQERLFGAQPDAPFVQRTIEDTTGVSRDPVRGLAAQFPAGAQNVPTDPDALRSRLASELGAFWGGGSQVSVTDPATTHEQELALADWQALQAGQLGTPPADGPIGDAVPDKTTKPAAVSASPEEKAKAKELMGSGTDRAALALQRLDKALAAGTITEAQHTDAVNGVASAKNLNQRGRAYKAIDAMVAQAAASQGAQPNVGVPAVSGGVSGASSAVTNPVAESSVAVAGPASVAAVPGVGTAAAGVRAGPATTVATGSGQAPASPTVVATNASAGSLLNRLKGKTAVLGGAIDFKALKMILEGEDPRLHHAVRLWLGVDKDGDRLDAPMTSKGAAETAFGAGSENDSLVRKAAAALGLTKGVRNAFHTGHAQANERAESTEQGEEGEAFTEDQGFGRTNTPGGAQGNTTAQGVGLISKKRWYAAARDKGVAALSDKELAQVVAKAAAFAQSDTPENKAALTGIMQEAAQRAKTSPGFQQEVNRAYTVEGGLSTTADTNESAMDEDGAAEATDTEDAAPSNEPGEEAERPKTKPAVTVVRRRKIEKPQLSVGSSRFLGRGRVAHTKASLTEALLKFLRGHTLGYKVHVLATIADLKHAPHVTEQALVEVTSHAVDGKHAVAIAIDTHVYLIADRIERGKERGIVLHELGSHVGLETLLTARLYNRLLQKIADWAAKDDGSIESNIAKKAIDRAAKFNTGNEAEERLAYFIEEAVNEFGLDPTSTALKDSPSFKEWVVALWRGFRRGVRMLGIVPGAIQAQDIVNLSYAAARLSLVGQWHGTTAQFRVFNTNFMGTGTGAQTYGWGHYIAARFGVALDYMNTEKSFKGVNLLIEALDKLADRGNWRVVGDVRHSVTDKLLVQAGTTLFGGGPIPWHTIADDSGLDHIDLRHVSGRGRERLDLKPIHVPGEMMALDTAVDPDALLMWDRPVKEQTPFVQEAIKEAAKQLPASFAPSPDEHGQDLYSALMSHLGSAKAASQFLRSVGVEGIKYADAFSRSLDMARASQHRAVQAANGRWQYVALDAHGREVAKPSLKIYATEDEALRAGAEKLLLTYNTVVFDDSALIRAASAQNAQRKRVRFSATDGRPTNSQADKLLDRIKPQTSDAITNITSMFNKIAPRFLTNPQLVEQYGKKLSPLADYVEQQRRMTQERTAQSMVYHDIAVEWDKLPKATKERLDGVMLRATMSQMHPDRPFTHEDNKHLDAAQAAAHAALAKQYEALPKTAKDIYQKALKALKDGWKQRREAYGSMVDLTFSKAMALAEGDTTKEDKVRQDMADALAHYDRQLSEIKGPYFPLMRFGDYLAIGESAAYLATRKKLDAAVGDERRELAKKVEAMKKDAKHYRVSAHETEGARNAAMREMASAGLEPRSSMTDQFIEGVTDLSKTSLDNVLDVIDASFSSSVAGPLRSAVSSIFLRSLPEMHALRREAQRKGIAGASEDMLRAFSSAGQQNSFYNARLMYAKQMLDSLNRMKADAKGDDKLSHIHREMEKRMALDMQYKETPVQDMLSAISWTYHLGASPSFLFMNSTQPWLVTGPMLAGRHGPAASMTALGRATKDALRILGAARMKDGKWDWWSGISVDTLPNTKEGNIERKMLRALILRGVLDEGAQHDMAMFADDSNRMRAKLARGLGWATQQVELVNRTASALAAFRLEYARALKENKPNAYDEALKYAYDTTLNSQFDYSAEGTARIMREGGGVPLAKLVFQFRRYQQGMLYALFSNAKRVFDPEQRKEALATLTYLTITAGLSAGVMGLPFMSAALLAVGLFSGDDDPEGTPEVKLRNALFQLSDGNKTMSDTLAKGIPALFGADLSKRIGLGDVASIFPMAKFNRRTGQENAGELALSALGPVGGVAANLWQSKILLEAGDVAGALEKAMPKMFADLAKGARFASDGMKDTGGNPTGTKLDAFDVFMRAAGVTPTAESRYYEGTAAKKNVEAAVDARKDRVARVFKAGVRSGDMAEAREMINEFNARHPENRILPRHEREWRKDVRQSAANRAADSGVKLGKKKEKIYNEVAAFAL